MEYTGRTYFKTAVTGKTQADGAFEVDVSDALEMGDFAKVNWAIQFATAGPVTAGTVQVAVKVPGAAGFADIDNEVDLAAGPFVVSCSRGPIEAFQFTPTAFDGTSYSVYLAAA